MEDQNNGKPLFQGSENKLSKMKYEKSRSSWMALLKGILIISTRHTSSRPTKRPSTSLMCMAQIKILG